MKITACFDGVRQCKLYIGSADSEQQWMRGLPRMLNKADLLEVRAAKPTQVLLTTDDSDSPVQGGRDWVKVRQL